MAINALEFILSDHPAAVKLREIADLKLLDPEDSTKHLRLHLSELAVEMFRVEYMEKAAVAQSLIEAADEVRKYYTSDEVVNSIVGKSEEAVHEILTRTSLDSVDLLDHYEKKFEIEVERRRDTLNLINEAASVLGVEIPSYHEIEELTWLDSKDSE